MMVVEPCPTPVGPADGPAVARGTVAVAVTSVAMPGDTPPPGAIIKLWTDGDTVAVSMVGADIDDGEVILFHGNDCCLSSVKRWALTLNYPSTPAAFLCF